MPLNLAEDPIKGLETYTKFINDNGGINGRKIVLDIQDDRFEAPGARTAADRLINDHKNFMVSGTLGIDQIAIVAAEAAKRGVPYTAAGGNETKPIPGMFQLSANYTTHVLQLADYMKIDPNLKGKRVGILVSDSEFIRPVGRGLQEALAGQRPQRVDHRRQPEAGRRTPTTTATSSSSPARTPRWSSRSPIRSPRSRSCSAVRQARPCGWTYSFSNFAHDSDTALALLTPTWATQQVRGLSAGCYYQAPEVNDRAKCANMRSPATSTSRRAARRPGTTRAAAAPPATRSSAS